MLAAEIASARCLACADGILDMFLDWEIPQHRALARNGIERSDCSQQQRYAQADFGAATGRIAAAVVADEKARTAELAAERAALKDKPAAGIKALRARRRAIGLTSSEGERIALAGASR